MKLSVLELLDDRARELVSDKENDFFDATYTPIKMPGAGVKSMALAIIEHLPDMNIKLNIDPSSLQEDIPPIVDQITSTIKQDFYDDSEHMERMEQNFPVVFNAPDIVNDIVVSVDKTTISFDDGDKKVFADMRDLLAVINGRDALMLRDSKVTEETFEDPNQALIEAMENVSKQISESSSDSGGSGGLLGALGAWWAGSKIKAKLTGKPKLDVDGKPKIDVDAPKAKMSAFQKAKEFFSSGDDSKPARSGGGGGRMKLLRAVLGYGTLGAIGLNSAFGGDDDDNSGERSIIPFHDSYKKITSSISSDAPYDTPSSDATTATNSISPFSQTQEVQTSTPTTTTTPTSPIVDRLRDSHARSLKKEPDTDTDTDPNLGTYAALSGVGLMSTYELASDLGYMHKPKIKPSLGVPMLNGSTLTNADKISSLLPEKSTMNPAMKPNVKPAMAPNVKPLGLPNPASSVKNAARTTAKVAGKGFSRFLPYANVALGGYDAYEIMNDETMGSKEKTVQLSGVGGGMAGAASGAAALGALGGMAGTIIPGVGNVVGGIVGAGIGGVIGYTLGESATESLVRWLMGDSASEEEIVTAQEVVAAQTLAEQETSEINTASATPKASPEDTKVFKESVAQQDPKKIAEEKKKVNADGFDPDTFKGAAAKRGPNTTIQKKEKQKVDSDFDPDAYSNAVAKRNAKHLQNEITDKVLLSKSIKPRLVQPVGFNTDSEYLHKTENTDIISSALYKTNVDSLTVEDTKSGSFPEDVQLRKNNAQRAEGLPQKSNAVLPLSGLYGADKQNELGSNVHLSTETNRSLINNVEKLNTEKSNTVDTYQNITNVSPIKNIMDSYKAVEDNPTKSPVKSILNAYTNNTTNNKKLQNPHVLDKPKSKARRKPVTEQMMNSSAYRGITSNYSNSIKGYNTWKRDFSKEGKVLDFAGFQMAFQNVDVYNTQPESSGTTIPSESSEVQSHQANSQGDSISTNAQNTIQSNIQNSHSTQNKTQANRTQPSFNMDTTTNADSAVSTNVHTSKIDNIVESANIMNDTQLARLIDLAAETAKNTLDIANKKTEPVAKVKTEHPAAPKSAPQSGRRSIDDVPIVLNDSGFGMLNMGYL